MKSVLIAMTVFLATAAFTACPPKPGPGPQPPTPVVDATIDSAPADDASVDASTDDATPPTPPAEDAGPYVSTCALACAALAAADCQHGTLTVCAAVLTGILSDGHVGNPQTGKSLTCDEIAQVRTKIDAMGLGFKCP